MFSFPSFINAKQQTESDLLYNDIRLLVQTKAGEIWANIDYGTTINELIKQGIDDIVIAEIQEELETKLNKYFNNKIIIQNIDIKQDTEKILINLTYIELRTGIYSTLQTEQLITNAE